MCQSVNGDSLVGCSGFVGSTLQKQAAFSALFGTRNIDEIHGRQFDRVVCAAAPAKKWIANREPLVDRQNIEDLIAHLKAMCCKTFILISTVDVFKDPVGVDEDTPVDEAGLHAYGVHRHLLEKFVEGEFPDHLIVRLPGLVGPGLRKNVIFDLLNENNLDAVDSRGIFQFYPMVNLWPDIETALHAGLRLVHLTAEPISVADVCEQGFGKAFENTLTNNPAIYDLRTRHSDVFGVQGSYQYNRRETIQAIRAYAQSEARTLKVREGSGR